MFKRCHEVKDRSRHKLSDNRLPYLNLQYEDRFSAAELSHRQF